MAFRLPAHIHEKMARVRGYTEKRQAEFTALDDEELAISAEFWRWHCQAPGPYEPDSPVYDATFWYIIIPEMIRRLKQRRCA